MIRVFIDGAHGTTGLEIAARLAGRDGIELLALGEAQRRDTAARRDALNAADVVVLCLPDDAAREAVALIDNRHTRVIDASTAHRTAPDWIYGFPEITGRDAVAQPCASPTPAAMQRALLRWSLRSSRPG